MLGKRDQPPAKVCPPSEEVVSPDAPTFKARPVPRYIRPVNNTRYWSTKDWEESGAGAAFPSPAPPPPPEPSSPRDTSQDDWGWLDPVEIPPYVYSPQWHRDLPHLLTNPPKNPIDPVTMWKIDLSSPSDDEEEYYLRGGDVSGVPATKPPSALLTSRRPNYPNLKPIKKFVGELPNPLMDRNIWAPDRHAKNNTEAFKRKEMIERILANGEDLKPDDGVGIPYDYSKYPERWDRRRGLDLTSFIPPLPSDDEVREARRKKAEEERRLKIGRGEEVDKEDDEEEEEEEDEDGEEGDVDGEGETDNADVGEGVVETDNADVGEGVVETDNVDVGDDDVVETENIDKQDDNAEEKVVVESNDDAKLNSDDDPKEDIEPPPCNADLDLKLDSARYEKENQVKPGFEEEPCPKLSPDVPFPAKLLGFIDRGYCLVEFRDQATIAQYKLLQESIFSLFGSNEGEDSLNCVDFSIPRDSISENMLVCAKWPRADGAIVRARIIKIKDDKGVALCKDMDSWEYDDVPFDQLFHIPPMFMDAPFLMHRCRLKGIEFFCYGNILKELAPLLPSLHSKVTITSYHTAADGIPVVGMDVKIRECLNPLLASKGSTITLSRLFSDAIAGFTRLPNKFVKGSVIKWCHVSHVGATGGHAAISLQSALAQRLTNIGPNPPRIKTSKEFNSTLKEGSLIRRMSDFEHAYFNLCQNIFLAHYYDDKAFYRVKVDERNYKMGSKMIRVLYIDFGNTETIPVADLIPCELVSPLLGRIPAQSFPCRLNGIIGIRDVDVFFEHLTIYRTQQAVVSGFQDPGATAVVDIYTLVKTEAAAPTGKNGVPIETREDWIYANKYLVDKGIATARPEGIVQHVTSSGSPCLKSVLLMKDIPLDENTTKYHSKCLVVGQRMRFYSTCRIEVEDGQRYAYVSIKKMAPRKKIMPDIPNTISEEDAEVTDDDSGGEFDPAKYNEEE